MAAPIPEGKCHVLQIRFYKTYAKNASGYHPGPVAPSLSDETSLE